MQWLGTPNTEQRRAKLAAMQLAQCKVSSNFRGSVQRLAAVRSPTIDAS